MRSQGKCSSCVTFSTPGRRPRLQYAKQNELYVSVFVVHVCSLCLSFVLIVCVCRLCVFVRVCCLGFVGVYPCLLFGFVPVVDRLFSVFVGQLLRLYFVSSVTAFSKLYPHFRIFFCVHNFLKSFHDLSFHFTLTSKDAD